MTLLNDALDCEQQYNLTQLKIDKATPEDNESLVRFFRQHPEVSFCDWQDQQQMKTILGETSTVCYVAKNEQQEVVGASLGGCLGSRGTVNHLAVSARWRKHGIASILAQKTIEYFKGRNIKRIFLFIDEENRQAVKFWSSIGFEATLGEITCELDI